MRAIWYPKKKLYGVCHTISKLLNKITVPKLSYRKKKVSRQ